MASVGSRSKSQLGVVHVVQLHSCRFLNSSAMVSTGFGISSVSVLLFARPILCNADACHCICGYVFNVVPLATCGGFGGLSLALSLDNKNCNLSCSFGNAAAFIVNRGYSNVEYMPIHFWKVK